MQLMIRFMKGMLTLALPWQVWMGLLLLANLVLPFAFWETLEAKVVLAGTAASLILMMFIFARLGFVKLLGLGHLPWLFTVPWLLFKLNQTADGSLFFYWLLSVVLLDGISLGIDLVDGVRYWRGERQAAALDA